MNTTSSWAYWTLIYNFQMTSGSKITNYPIFSDLPFPYNIYFSNFTGFLKNFGLESGIHSNMDPHCTCNWSSQCICRHGRWQIDTWRMDVKTRHGPLDDWREGHWHAVRVEWRYWCQHWPSITHWPRSLWMRMVTSTEASSFNSYMYVQN